LIVRWIIILISTHISSILAISVFIISIVILIIPVIAVSGTDVYVAGTVNGYATYWKNGIAVTLSNVSSSANSIFITNQ
jgi:hypothetical protein